MLTKKQKEVLEYLVKENDDDGFPPELVQSIPGGWWIGLKKISGKIGWALLRKCFITSDSFSKDNFYYYTITEEGRKALEDPHYECDVYKKFKSEQKIL